jgi:predicted CxxxxCH...CXXCH cytochrome family protein
VIKRPAVVILLLTLLWSVYVYAQAGPGDGYLLRRSEEETCHACHKTDRNTSPTDPTWSDAIKIHNADRFGKCSDPAYDGTSETECTSAGGTWTPTTKWSGTWGLSGGKYGEFRCTTCHTAHGTRNIFLLRESIRTPDGSNWDSIGTSDTLTVNFREKSGTPGSATYAMGDDTACSDPSYTNQADCETNGGTWIPRTTSTKPCEACHSITGYHRYDTSGQTVFGHNNAVDCNNCHSHRTGFVGKGCDTCHGFPPVVDTAGGPQGIVNDPDWGITGSVTAGAHDRHVNGKGFSCGTCHNGGMDSATRPKDHSITIGFDLFSGAYTSGIYDGQTTLTNGYTYSSGSAGTTVTAGGALECSNIYCHGSTLDVNGDMDNGTDITPVWNDPTTGACGTCHGAAPDSAPVRGMHFLHTSSWNEHRYPCGLCHTDPATDESIHVNNQSEVIFSADPKTSGGTYDGTLTVMDGYGNCTNIYCHSNVQTDPPGGPLTYATVNWGGFQTYSCNPCHEGEPDHFSSPMSGNTTGSHTKHASYGRFGCVTCHATGDPNIDPDGGWDCAGCHAAYHANYSVDVIMITKYGGTYSGTPQPGDAYGSCDNTYCHSIGDTSVTSGQLPPVYGGSIYSTATWGSGAIGCNACHGRTTTDGMPDYTNGGAGTESANSHAIHVITNGITCNICHYNTTADGMSITNTLYHINKNNTEVSFDPSGGGSGGTYDPATGIKQCSSVSCHPGQTPQWGGP